MSTAISSSWRVEQLVQEGGLALITGESGTGKSVALRIVAERLAALRDVVVGVLDRPQSKTADFYRELGDLFSVKLKPSNRWGGFKSLRERWKTHLASSRIRPVLLVDEAQEMAPEVLSELRILSSADFDATSLLTVVLAGDGRLPELLRHQDLVPLGTRIRARLVMESAPRDELLELLCHALAKAGNSTLMTAELMDTLVDHSAGNYRLLMTNWRGSYVGMIRRLFNKHGVVWQTGEMGKVDEGGGVTVAKFLATYGMEIIDCGTSLLSRHSPFEISSKADVYRTYKAYRVFLEEELG